MKRERCRCCSARTLDEAGKLCRATQGIDGDYHCPGDAPGEDDVDEQGYFIYPTKKGERLIAQRIDEMVAAARARGEI